MPIYMPPEIEKLYKETLEESKAEGKAEGKVEGKVEGMTSTILSLVREGLLSMDVAIKKLNLSEKELKKLLVN